MNNQIKGISNLSKRKSKFMNGNKTNEDDDIQESTTMSLPRSKSLSNNRSVGSILNDNDN